MSNPAPLWGNRALLATVVHPDDQEPLAELRGSDVLVQASNRAALCFGDAVVAAGTGTPLGPARCWRPGTGCWGGAPTSGCSCARS